MKPYDTSKNWIHFLTRPSTLLGASLWSSWYQSSHFKEVFGLKQDFLIIEEPKGIVRAYRRKEQMEKLWIKAEEIAQNKELCKQLYREAIAYNKEAENVLQQKNIKDVKEAVEFFWKVAVYCTTFPYLTYQKLCENGCDDKELMELGEQLRAQSFYPRIIDEIITPLAIKKIKGAEHLTIFEVFEEKTKDIEKRTTAKQQFIYQCIEKVEQVFWTDNNKQVVIDLEPEMKESKEIKGQCACAGSATGTARVILKMEDNLDFNKGDILVTICSSPDFMPVLSKAAAIVTDEGGVTCHAAVISRELNIPCIIGTKNATMTIKDGDRIEVDANKGTVKKL